MTDTIEAALEAVDNSMEKIKAFTRVALNSDANEVVRLWQEELARRLLIGEDALPLVYCCNDALQESKGEVNTAYRRAYMDILEDEFRAILSEQPDSKDSVKKVLKVWSERQVLDRASLQKLRRSLESTAKEGEEAENVGDQEVGEQAKTDVYELQRMGLENLTPQRILSLLTWISEQKDTDTDLAITAKDEAEKLKIAAHRTQDISNLTSVISEAKDFTDRLIKRRRCIQGHRVVAMIAKQTLQKTVQRAEEALQSAIEDLAQSEYAKDVLGALIPVSKPVVEVSSTTLRLLPKKEKVHKQIVQGPDLSFSKERILKEGVTAEAASKAERPMMFHKGLQKWVPLYSGDDSDTWRE